MPTNAAILNVILAVYDLTWHFNTLNDIMMNHGTGVFHLGVLIMGVGEYSYGERGVCQLRVPGNIGQHVHRVDMPISTCTVPAGTTPEQHVASALCRVAHQGSFYRGGYNLLSRNCINFAEALVMELTGQEIPETFRSAARTGKLAVGALDALSSLGSQLIDLAFGSRHHSPTSAASSSMSSTSASDVILISPAKHAPIHFYTPPTETVCADAALWDTVSPACCAKRAASNDSTTTRSYPTSGKKFSACYTAGAETGNGEPTVVSIKPSGATAFVPGGNASAHSSARSKSQSRVDF